MNAERHIDTISKKDLKDIKLIVFDVDGVLVPRGTKISQHDNITTLETKRISNAQLSQIKKLHEKGYLLNISSGRGLYMLQDMFRTVLPYVSITYENGSASWLKGDIVQHVNSYTEMEAPFKELLEIKHQNIKGFEPKEIIITIHCTDRVDAIEKVMSRYPKLYCIWNGEAYDMGIKEVQTKGRGLHYLIKHLGLKKENVLAIGDNLNDIELLGEAGIAVSADNSRVKGDYYVPLEGERLPADIMMECILNAK